MANRLALSVLLLAAALGAPASAAAQPGQAKLTIVFVLDGLRPDSITPDETPTLWRLSREGVTYLNGHAVFPTVTRANAAAMGTGMYPGRNGILGNTLY